MLILIPNLVPLTQRLSLLLIRLFCPMLASSSILAILNTVPDLLHVPRGEVGDTRCGGVHILFEQQQPQSELGVGVGLGTLLHLEYLLVEVRGQGTGGKPAQLRMSAKLSARLA